MKISALSPSGHVRRLRRRKDGKVMMKRMSASISPQKIGKVKDAFEKAGYPRNTIHYSYLPSSADNNYKARAVSWQGNEYLAVPIEKIKVELIVADKDVDNVRRILTEKARINGSNRTSNGRFEYALIPKSEISKTKESKKVQYADMAGRKEPLEVVQIPL